MKTPRPLTRNARSPGAGAGHNPSWRVTLGCRDGMSPSDIGSCRNQGSRTCRAGLPGVSDLPLTRWRHCLSAVVRAMPPIPQGPPTVTSVCCEAKAIYTRSRGGGEQLDGVLGIGFRTVGNQFRTAPAFRYWGETGSGTSTTCNASVCNGMRRNPGGVRDWWRENC